MEEQKDLGSYSEDGAADAAQVPCAVGYTPGPWESGCLTDDETRCNCAYIFSPGHCGSVATVNYSETTAIEDGDNPTMEEAKANAHLIAAAPELLSTLIAVREFGLDDFTPGEQELYDRMDAAIAKALGQ